MSEGLKLEMLQAAVKVLKKNAIPVRTVLTDKEAKELTKIDPSGHLWQVGDLYYHIPIRIKSKF